jgi:CyaY protein
MDGRDFERQAEAALASLYGRLAAAAEEYEFDVDFNAGALTVEFEEPREKFVVSPNGPVRQIWISALVKSFKLDWSEPRGAFVLAAAGQSLDELLVSLMRTRLGPGFAF